MTKYILILIAFVLIASKPLWVPIAHDITMAGEGHTDVPLKVDTSIIATLYDIEAAKSGMMRVIAEGHPNEAITNSVITDQDFTSIGTIPGGSLVDGKIYEVILSFKVVAGTSTALWSPYIKLGSTKVITPNAGVNYTNGVTHYISTGIYIHGTTVASATSQVKAYNTFSAFMLGAVNATGPQSIDTESDLPVVPGITFSATGSTETFTLESFQLKEKI